MYYNPFPQTYIVAGENDQDTGKMSKEEYVDFLRKKIAVLEKEYDAAMSDFRFARAFKISKQLSKAEEELDKYLGIN